MPFEVEYTDEFAEWWDTLTEDEQNSVDAGVEFLEAFGPRLPFPHSSGVESSRHSHMRELRIQHRGRPFRVLYAFDPRRVALLLIGGDKTGDRRWYERTVPIADDLYDEHLRALESEG
ncbi:MAG: type II toxin-antitoxin system RelE/ParE family toxin [Longimicrobiaceae bacterium]